MQNISSFSLPRLTDIDFPLFLLSSPNDLPIPYTHSQHLPMMMDASRICTMGPRPYLCLSMVLTVVSALVSLISLSSFQIHVACSSTGGFLFSTVLFQYVFQNRVAYKCVILPDDFRFA